MNRKNTNFLVIMASIGFAILAAGLVITLPMVMASNFSRQQQSISAGNSVSMIVNSRLENNSTQQTESVPDSTMTDAIVLPPVSAKIGLLPPDMIAPAGVGEDSRNPQSLILGGQPGNSHTPSQIEAGEFIGINGAACAYKSFTDTLAVAKNGDVIYVNQGTWVGRIGNVSKNLTFVAANTNCTKIATGGVTIDGNAESVDIGGVIEISATKRVTLSHLTLTNGSAITGGIAAVNYGASLVLDHSTLSDGNALIGGGVFVIAGNLTLNESSVFSNTAQMYGGGIYGKEAPKIVVRNNSQVAGNLTSDPSGTGGGIYLIGNEGRITVTASTIISNTASYAGGIRMNGINKLYLQNQAQVKYNRAANGWGGAILSTHSTLYIEDALLEQNYASAEGGAIHAGDSNVLISGASIFDNSSGNYGGGIFIGNNSTVNINNSQVISNATTYWGGGIYVVSNNTVNIEGNSHIDRNKSRDANGIGGGMYIFGDNSHITITASSVMSNVAPLAAGGIRLNSASSLTLVEGTQVSVNQGSGTGGGLATSNGAVVIRDSVFENNSATGDGGAIWLDSGELSITDASLTDNYSGDSGGGIFHSGGNLVLYAVSKAAEISNNDAATEGGGLYDESGLTTIVEAKNGHPFKFVGNTAHYGGGVYIKSATILKGLGDIDFVDNIATISGGGICIEEDAAIDISASSSNAAPDFLSNQATGEDGGAIYALKSDPLSLTGARIGNPSKGNSAPNGRGGGLYIQSSSLDLMDVSFYDNSALGNGGAMALYTSTLVMESIYDTLPAKSASINELAKAKYYCNPANLAADQYCAQFSNNSTPNSNGGALFLEDSTADITNAAFMGNSANIGAAIYNYRSQLSLHQVRVSDNESFSLLNPSIIYIDGGSASGGSTVLNAIHTTIADNQGTAVNYSLYTSGAFNNNIIWGNESRGNILPYATASCNNTQDRSLGSNNISTNPLFIVTSRGKYHLPLFSPSVDVCSGNTYFDLDGYPRPQGLARDMGAFEAMEPRQFLSVVLR